MENQISNIITILTALLTGGFLMLFIENQQITTYVIERLHQGVLIFGLIFVSNLFLGH